VQEDKGVKLHHLPEFEQLLKDHPDPKQRDAKVDEWFDGKMTQLKGEVARVNNEGWLHGDIVGNDGNARWNPETGKPSLIDWGDATNWKEKVAEQKQAGYKGPRGNVQKSEEILTDTWRTHLDAHVKEWTDKQQGVTPAKLGGGCE
jgi:hypothetical protein